MSSRVREPHVMELSVVLSGGTWSNTNTGFTAYFESAHTSVSIFSTRFRSCHCGNTMSG